MQTDFTQLIDPLRQYFARGATRPESWRRQQLDGLEALIDGNASIIHDALRKDLGKSPFESWLTETQSVRSEVSYVRKHLHRWLTPAKVPTPLPFKPGVSLIAREPLGVVLVIGPWNYPFQLIAAPLAGALASGNCVVVKPSEYAPATAACFAELLPQYLAPEAVVVIQGGPSATSELLAESFDHIFFTGSRTVGKLVMQAAAEQLTPVTLELGGKSPCIMTTSARLDVAAKRIVWGKFLNAGQTCVAPDYLLVPAEQEATILQALDQTIHSFYGTDPSQSKDYGRIVNRQHVDRLLTLMEDGDIVAGGRHNADLLYIEPTVLTQVSLESRLMEEEIFGPLLPVIPYTSLDDALHLINRQPPPLALYVFSEDRSEQTQVLERTQSGTACINETILQLANPALPFGGRGASGMGCYHGRWSFETFTQPRGILNRSTRFDIDLRYPPYSDAKQKWMRRLN